MLMVGAAVSARTDPPAAAAVGALAAPGVLAPAPAPPALTLETALRLALTHNPELRAATARVEAATGRADQARRWPNPELELAAEDWPADRGGFSDAKQTLGVAQTLPFPGKKQLDRAIGTAAVRATEAELDLRRRELSREVKIAFFQVLAAQELVRVAGQLAQVAEAAARVARRRVEAGAAAEQEQLRAEIALEQARAEQAGFERDLAVARQSLATRIGRPDLGDVPVVGALTDPVDPARFADAPEDWLASHPALVAARTGREQAALGWRRARLEPYPDVRLGVAGGRESSADGSAIIEFRVSLPLPIFDRAKGRQQEARATAALAEAEAVAVAQRLWHDWNTARQRWRTAAEQVAGYRERILPKAEQALRLVQRGFEEGKFGLLDLLDTQRTAAETRRAYVEKLLELHSARAELEALLGTPPPERDSTTTPSRPEPRP